MSLSEIKGSPLGNKMQVIPVNKPSVNYVVATHAVKTAAKGTVISKATTSNVGIGGTVGTGFKAPFVLPAPFNLVFGGVPQKNNPSQQLFPNVITSPGGNNTPPPYALPAPFNAIYGGGTPDVKNPGAGLAPGTNGSTVTIPSVSDITDSLGVSDVFSGVTDFFNSLGNIGKYLLIGGVALGAILLLKDR
jgi:hypothetical protein